MKLVVHKVLVELEVEGLPLWETLRLIVRVGVVELLLYTRGSGKVAWH
jgi:hypothetical protein